MTVNKPILTIVVPVYNVEKYLAQCLDSLVEQTVLAHKVIVVNDGTRDSSGEIAKDYATRYPDMIRYVEQENQGLGAARNTGLALADTEYVTFLDSDDWQDRLFVEKLLAQLALHEEKPDLIFTLPRVYDDAAKKLSDWLDKPVFEELFFPGKEENAASLVLNTQVQKRLYELEPNACRRVYRLDFLKEENFSFPVGVKWEDVQPHFQLLHKARRCIGLKETGFIYRVNSGSSITSSGGKGRLDMLPVFTSVLEMAGKWPLEERVYVLRSLWAFTEWFLYATDMDHIRPLLKGLHKLFRSVPSGDFKFYFACCSRNPAMEKVLTFAIRSPFCGLLADNLIRRQGVWALGKLRRILG